MKHSTSTSVTVAASPVYYDAREHEFPMTITAVPGSGGTMAVAYSTTPNAASLGASATWINWPSGTVAVNTSDTLVSPVTGLRFTAATATGTVEVVA